MYKICIIIGLFFAQCMVAQEVSKQQLVRAVSSERVQIKTDSEANNGNAPSSLIMNRQAEESSSLEVEDTDNTKLHLKRAVSNDRIQPLETRLRRVEYDSVRKSKG